MNVKYPINLRFILSMSCLCLITIVGYWVNKNEMFLVIGGFSSLWIAAAIIRRSLRPRVLQMKQDTLIIQNKQLKADEINHLYIEFLETVGIKPKHKKIVPQHLVFEFVNKDDLKKLTDWAERHDVQIKHQPFVKWM